MQFLIWIIFSLPLYRTQQKQYVFLSYEASSFIKNKLFSHMIYPDYRLLSLYSSQFLHIPCTPTWIYSLSVYHQKKKGFYKITTKCNKIKYNKVK